MRHRRILILVSILAIVGMLMVACAPAAAPTPTPTKPPLAITPGAPTPAAPTPTKASPAAEQPRYGGTLIAAAYGDPPNLDPHQSAVLMTVGRVAPCYSGLLQYDPQDNEKIIGDLAESWQVSPDGKVYTFRLNQGIRWHDGKPFTAEDAKFGLDRARDPKVGVGRVNLRAIDKVEVADKDTVRVTLKSPSASLLAMVALGLVVMLPKHAIETKGDMKKDVMGTGPFKFKDYQVGVSFEVVKNPDYFVKGRPYLDGIKWYIIKDAATRFAAFRTGRVKFTELGTGGFTPTEAKTLRKEMPGVVIHQYQMPGMMFMSMNCGRPPWTDVRVRKAVSLAIDRQQCLAVVGEGVGTVGGPVPSSQWSIPQEELLKMPGYRQPKDQDIAEAKRLLAEAGFPQGFKTTITARDLAQHQRVAEFVTGQLTKIGIDARMEVLESASYTDRMNRLVYEVQASARAFNVADPSDMSEAYVTGSRVIGFGTFNDPRVDELIQKQEDALDPVKRKEIVLEMQRAILDLSPVAIFYWMENLLGHYPEVKGYNLKVGMYNQMKMQDVWLAQ